MDENTHARQMVVHAQTSREIGEIVDFELSPQHIFNFYISQLSGCRPINEKDSETIM